MGGRVFLALLSLAVVASAIELRHLVKRQTGNNNIGNYLAQACGRNPHGNDSQAFHVAHPSWCNAFFTCQSPKGHPQCTFCAEGTYFKEGGLICDSLNGVDPNTARGPCEGKQYAAHERFTEFQTKEWCLENGRDVLNTNRGRNINNRWNDNNGRNTNDRWNNNNGRNTNNRWNINNGQNNSTVRSTNTRWNNNNRG